MPILFLMPILVLAGIVWSYWRFNQNIQQDTSILFTEAGNKNKTVITEAMLTGLPAPIQRYLRYTGIVGKPIVQTVRLKEVGKIRRGETQPWMIVKANEYYSVNPPAFVWDANVSMNGLPLIRGEDKYLHNRGEMLITLATLYKIVNAHGTEIDQGSMMRYLNEMTWFPTSFLSENISYKPIDDHHAEVTLTHQDKSVSATLVIDDEGKLLDFIAKRYRDLGNGQYSLDTWTTPFTQYGEMAGLKLPIAGKAVWKLPEGDLEYIQLEITELEYDVAAIY